MSAQQNGIMPAPGELLYVSIMEKICEYIEKNHIRIGERLPGERELSAMLGVSRNSVREAIRELGVQGVLSVQAGRGTFLVGEVTDRAMLIRLKKHNFIELFEVKTVLERYVTAKLTGRIEEKLLCELEGLAKKMIALAEAGIFPQELDDIFHDKILEEYPNRQLIEIIRDMKGIFAEYNAEYFNTGIGIINESGQSIFDTIPLHLKLVECMRQGDAGKAVEVYDEIAAIDKSIYGLIRE